MNYSVLTNEHEQVCVVEKITKRIVFDGTIDALGELLEREKEHQETMAKAMEDYMAGRTRPIQAVLDELLEAKQQPEPTLMPLQSGGLWKR